MSALRSLAGWVAAHPVLTFWAFFAVFPFLVPNRSLATQVRQRSPNRSYNQAAPMPQANCGARPKIECDNLTCASAEERYTWPVANGT